jgi:hypothetical protein
MIVSQTYLFLDEKASELRKDCENFVGLFFYESCLFLIKD